MRDVDGGRVNTQCVIASKRQRMILTFETKRKILQKVGNGQSDAKSQKCITLKAFSFRSTYIYYIRYMILEKEVLHSFRYNLTRQKVTTIQQQKEQKSYK